MPRCNICRIAFASEKELAEHDTSHHGLGASALRPPSHSCEICQITFASDIELSLHEMQDHGPEASALRPPTIYEQLELTPPRKRTKYNLTVSQCCKEFYLSNDNFERRANAGDETVKLWEIPRAASPTASVSEIVPQLLQVGVNDIEESQQFNRSPVSGPRFVHDRYTQQDAVMGDPYCLHELDFTKQEAEFSFRGCCQTEAEIEKKLRKFCDLSAQSPREYLTTLQVDGIMGDPYCLHEFEFTESEAEFSFRRYCLTETEIEEKMQKFRELALTTPVVAPASLELPQEIPNDVMEAGSELIDAAIRNFQVGGGVVNNNSALDEWEEEWSDNEMDADSESERTDESQEITDEEVVEAEENFIIENANEQFDAMLERHHNAIFNTPPESAKRRYINYDFRRMPLPREELYRRLVRVLAEGNIFQLNVAEAYLLENINTHELKYYHANPENTSIIPHAMTIRSIEDLNRFLDIVYDLGILEGTRNPTVDRPDTIWRLIMIPNVLFIITKTKFLIGNAAGIPEDLLSLRSLVSFTHNSKGKRYTDNLCLFRCIAAHQRDRFDDKKRKNKYRNIERETHALARKYGIDPKAYPGVEIQDLGKAEQIFNVAINVYSMSSERKLGVVRISSVSKPKGGTVKLLLINDHFCYITNLPALSSTHACSKCKALFDRRDSCVRHEKVCERINSKPRVTYPGGVYKPLRNVFELLEPFNIKVPDELRFTKDFAVFDIESLLSKLPTTGKTTEKTTEHQIVSVSVASTTSKFKATSA
uniref:uncharacterized protein LOC113474412 n=1 Tax=Ciona intestinalis TaxID=7719 RepID=UPI000EF4851C|nr:uncharacterized protein LOC113474412 [Ciona intestinalis]|eukprot:XP_026691167.1 uncharacterized protein LOC113474412 [Ciona intestinalis]